MFAAPDAAAELVQLGQTEAVCAVDHHHRGVGHVDANFDHGGGHQQVQLAIAEPAHHLVLLPARQPPVEQPEAEIGKHLVGQALVLLGGSARVQVFRLLHQRADDERLAAGFHLLPDEPVGGGTLVFGHQPGENVLPTRRQLING